MKLFEKEAKAMSIEEQFDIFNRLARVFETFGVLLGIGIISGIVEKKAIPALVGILFTCLILEWERFQKRDITESKTEKGFATFEEIMDTNVQEWSEICGEEISINEFYSIKYVDSYSKIFKYMKERLSDVNFHWNDGDIIEELEFEISNDTQDIEETRIKIVNVAVLFATAVMQFPCYRMKLTQADSVLVEEKINAFYVQILLKKFFSIFGAYFNVKEIAHYSITESLKVALYMDDETTYEIVQKLLQKHLL